LVVQAAALARTDVVGDVLAALAAAGVDLVAIAILTFSGIPISASSALSPPGLGVDVGVLRRELVVVGAQAGDRIAVPRLSGGSWNEMFRVDAHGVLAGVVEITVRLSVCPHIRNDVRSLRLRPPIDPEGSVFVPSIPPNGSSPEPTSVL